MIVLVMMKLAMAISLFPFLSHENLCYEECVIQFFFKKKLT